MIANITKRIRRLVTVLPAGELIVDLMPGGSLILGIKGGKAADKLTINLEQAWIDKQFINAQVPLAVVPTPEPVTTEKQLPANLSAIRAKINTATFSPDPKVNYAILARIDEVFHNAINPSVEEG